MSERPLTRRSALALGTGALAGTILRPHRALAALLRGPAPLRLGAREVGRLAAGRAVTVLLDSPADLVGLQWDTPARAGLEVRFRDRSGAWTRWVSGDGRGHGPDAPGGSGHIGDPLWTGGTLAVELRAARTVSGLRLHLVEVSGGPGAGRGGALAGLGASAPALAAPVLESGPGQPPIIARQAWARGQAPPRVTPEYGAVRLAFVHHTENPNGYSHAEVPAMLRAIYAFHRYVNGWNDIGYNFVIDLYGRIFEARAGGIDEPVVGAQAGGYNLVSTGVAVLGSFMSTPISAAARTALQNLLAWKLSLHGVPSRGRVVVRVNPAGAAYSRFPANARVPLPRIAGHRDGDSTACPGDVLYATLPRIRARVRALAPRPTALTLALGPPGAPPPPAAGAPPPAPAAPQPGSPAAVGAPLGGVLAYLDGAPIAGAQVLVQARTVSRRGEAVAEQTIAEAWTDSRGRYVTPGSWVAAAVGPTWLRALYAGAGGSPGAPGATVSPPLAVAPAISPPATVPSP